MTSLSLAQEQHMDGRPLRIAFHFYSVAQGGIERNYIALARELLTRGYLVDFVLVEKKGELLDQVPEGVRIVDLGAKRSLGSIRPLMRYFRQDPPDAMFAILGPQNIMAIIARKLARSRVWLAVVQQNALSIQARAGISTQQSMVPMAYRLFLRGADKVIAVSRGVADDLAAATGYPRDRIGVLYNSPCPEGGPELFLPKPQHPFLESGEPVLIGVGRLVAQKDWPTLIEAFALLRKTRPARLVIAGVGPDKAALEALIAARGVADSVDLVGFQPNPLAWMAVSNIFVLSSAYEGFGNVVVEALAAGTPVVSTDCNFGPAEILEDGKWGRLVPVGDAPALAAALAAELDSPHDPEALRARARDFSVAAAADAYLETAFGKGHAPAA